MGLKIACFVDSYLPYKSGVVHSVQTLNSQLALLGNRVSVFAPMYPGCRGDEDGLYRFAAVPAPSNRDYFLAFPFPRRAYNIIESLNPDIIHVHQPFGLGWTGQSCARRKMLPLVYTCHTLYEYYSHYLPLPRRMAKTAIKKVCTLFSNQCNLIIVPTEATRDYLRQLGVVSPIKVIPTGIDTKEFSVRKPGWLRRRYNIPAEEKILLCVGRLGPEKNIDFILRCFSILVTRNTGIRLVLVGKGPQEQELKNTAACLGIRDKVTFTGQLSKSEVINCYFGADIFIFASVSETQGLVVPEAKTAGLPVVAVDANGVREMVQNGVDGFLTSLNPVEFTHKIELLLNDNILRQIMSRNALRNAQKLSARSYAENVLLAYKSLLGKTTGDTGIIQGEISFW